MRRPIARPGDPRPLFVRGPTDSLVVPAAVVSTPWGPVIVTLYAISTVSYFAAPVPPWYDVAAERLAALHDDVPALRRPWIAQNKPAELYRLSDVCGLVRWLPWGG